MKVYIFKINKGANNNENPAVENVGKKGCIDEPIIIGNAGMEFYIDKPCYVRLSINTISNYAAGIHQTVQITTMVSSMIDLYMRCKHIIRIGCIDQMIVGNEFTVESIIDLGEVDINIDTASGICMDILYTKIPMVCLESGKDISKIVRAMLLAKTHEERERVRYNNLNIDDYCVYAYINRAVCFFKNATKKLGYTDNYIGEDIDINNIR